MNGFGYGLAPLLAQETHYAGWLHKPAEKIAHALHLGPDGPANVEPLLYMWVLVLPALAFIAWRGTRTLERVPGPLQNFLESIVELLDSFTRNIIGEKHGSRFTAFIGSLFIVVFAANIIGIIPGVLSPDSRVNQTLALALCTFVMTHGVGFTYGGIAYLKHFAGEPLWLAPIALPAHIAGEIARPLSLTLRLFGNIFGEDTAIAVFIWLGFAMAYYIPLQLPMLALACFTSLVQGLIFAMLSAVYIGGALPHEHHHDHDHGHGHDHDHDHAHGHDHGHSPAVAH